MTSSFTNTKDYEIWEQRALECVEKVFLHFFIYLFIYFFETKKFFFIS